MDLFYDLTMEVINFFLSDSTLIEQCFLLYRTSETKFWNFSNDNNDKYVNAILVNVLDGWVSKLGVKFQRNGWEEEYIFIL